MKLSAETRWFWKGDPTKEVDEWFRKWSDVPPGGGALRVDRYIRDTGQAELGIKLRGGKSDMEIKGLIATRDECRFGSHTAGVELWCKWTATLDAGSMTLVPVHKTRLLRKFASTGTGLDEIPLGPDEKPLSARALPATGCNVELTRITGDNVRIPNWWTLGFEAFGDLATVEATLRDTVARLGRSPAPNVESAIPASYPTWLARVRGSTSAT